MKHLRLSPISSIKFIFNWRMVVLRCWVGVCRTTWIRWMDTNMSSPYGLPPFHPTPLGHHGALSWAPYRAASTSAICPRISPPSTASMSPHLTPPGHHKNTEPSTLATQDLPTIYLFYNMLVYIQQGYSLKCCVAFGLKQESIPCLR